MNPHMMPSQVALALVGGTQALQDVGPQLLMLLLGTQLEHM
jgi:hypothetical protein